MKKILIGLIIITLTSCGKYPKGVAESLKLAGDNKTELEKVLEHYRKNPEDKLKYQAACFLIDNMKWHSSLNIDFPEELMELYLTDDSLTRLRYKIENGLVDSSDFIPPTNAQVREESYRNKKDFAKNVLPNIHVPQSPVSDLKVIDSEFLINNIGLSFFSENICFIFSCPGEQILIKAHQEFCEKYFFMF